jgi:RyR domain
MRVEQIARVCQDANASYCRSIGDSSQKSWDEGEDWQRESAIRGVQLCLEKHAAGEPVSPSLLHDNWLEQKRAEGWKYGPVKDSRKKEDPSFVPFADLPLAQQMKDHLFRGIVFAFSPFASEA